MSQTLVFLFNAALKEFDELRKDYITVSEKVRVDMN